MCCLTLDQGLELENGFSPDTIKILKERGHKILETTSYGELLVMPSGVMQLNGEFFPAGCNRADGGGGALTEFGTMAIDGICFK